MGKRALLPSSTFIEAWRWPALCRPFAFCKIAQSGNDGRRCMAALHERTEDRDGMRIDWNVPIKMDDGLVLRADVFRPMKDGKFPVLLTYGPYAKNLAFQDGYPSAWRRMVDKHPDVAASSTNKYQNKKDGDPEKWVPHKNDNEQDETHGTGCSPGYIDHFSPRETKDFDDSIEWAGVQPWSNGKVGLNGFFYFGFFLW